MLGCGEVGQLWSWCCLVSQEVFELRYAKMPEEPLAPPTKKMLKPGKEAASESSEQSHSDASGDSSSSDESESESERASQLSYLQKQVRGLRSDLRARH